VNSEKCAAAVDEKPHRKLKVWQASMDFVIELYNEVQHFPAHEKFGIVGQLQWAAVSIPSNIAEGAARKNTRELLQFLYIRSENPDWKSVFALAIWKRPDTNIS
jgi:hypothetical protein